MNKGNSLMWRGASVCMTNFRAQLIKLRNNIGRWPIRGCELIDVRELIEEYSICTLVMLIALKIVFKNYLGLLYIFEIKYFIHPTSRWLSQPCTGRRFSKDKFSSRILGNTVFISYSAEA